MSRNQNKKGKNSDEIGNVLIVTKFFGKKIDNL